MTHDHHTLWEHLKPTTDLVSIGITIGALAQILPAIAALFTIIWTAIRIYETDTIQRILGKSKITKD